MILRRPCIPPQLGPATARAVDDGVLAQSRAHSRGGPALGVGEECGRVGEDCGDLGDDLAAELDDQEVGGVLQHQSSEAFEEPREAFLLEDGVEAVPDPLVPGEDGGDLDTGRVQVVDDAPGALQVETVEDRL